MGKIGRILGLSAVCILAGCGRTETSDCRELFEKHYEINVRACMQTMSGVDSVVARKRSECMLNKLYEIDSTFVLMSGKELSDFIEQNRPALEACDRIQNADF